MLRATGHVFWATLSSPTHSWLGLPSDSPEVAKSVSERSWGAGASGERPSAVEGESGVDGVRADGIRSRSFRSGAVVVSTGGVKLKARVREPC